MFVIVIVTNTVSGQDFRRVLFVIAVCRLLPVYVSDVVIKEQQQQQQKQNTNTHFNSIQKRNTKKKVKDK